MLLFALACVVVAAIPTLYGLMATPVGFRYTGHEVNADDHMVYAAWMWQAAHGRLLFDNRFAVDSQPGLTLHIWFLLLGWVAKITGIFAATLIGRLATTLAFCFLLARLVRRLRSSVYGFKLALVFVVLAGGLGFLPFFWHMFGQAMVRPAPEFVQSLMNGRLPTDVWQPEGYVLPSMLTNGLFMISLCLILTVFMAFLHARRHWARVPIGAAAMALLMNVHSYDALLVTLTMVGFLAAVLVRKQFTVKWAVRALLIGAGAIPPALYFLFVLKNDPVFAARAATETYSPNFRQVLVGYLPPILLGFTGLALRIKKDPENAKRRYAGLALAGLLILALAVLAGGHDSGYFLSPAGWSIVFVLAVASVGLLADRSPAWNLVTAWAMVGLVAIYFPALFQRKLAMGLAIPWALLAAMGLEAILRDRERSARNLSLTLAILVLGGSALRWTFRQVAYASANVSSTTRHPVYLGPDASAIVDYLDKADGRKVVLSWPGTATPGSEPDTFQTPQLPDLAPFFSGLAGAYTYAGHWSETPHYTDRVRDSYRFFLAEPLQGIEPMNREERAAFIAKTGANYAVVPSRETFGLPLTPATDLGEVVVSGTQFDLVKLR